MIVNEKHYRAFLHKAFPCLPTDILVCCIRPLLINVAQCKARHRKCMRELLAGTVTFLPKCPRRVALMRQVYPWRTGTVLLHSIVKRRSAHNHIDRWNSRRATHMKHLHLMLAPTLNGIYSQGIADKSAAKLIKWIARQNCPSDS